MYYAHVDCFSSEDFKDVDDVAFKFKRKSLVATNTLKVVDDDVLEEDEVFQGTFEIPSIIGRQLPVMAVDPNLTYIIIQDDDCEFMFVVIVTTLTQSLISTQM